MKIAPISSAISAGDQKLRLVLAREREHLVVIDKFGVATHAVGDRVVQLPAKTDLGAVCEVAAVRERHAEHGVARLDRRHEHGHVGLRARVRLDVGVVGAEELLGAVDRELLGEIDVFAAAVVATARIAFGVLVGQDARRRFADGPACVILRRDQLEVVALARLLEVNGGRDFRVQGVEQGSVERLHAPDFHAGGSRPVRTCVASTLVFFDVRQTAGA